MFEPIPKPPKRGPKPRKPMKRTRIRFKGFDELWEATRALWFETFPPDYRGYYQCALCPYEVHIDETTLDHIITRSRDSTLIYVISNLQPAHGLCNTRRGSMTMEAYESRYGKGGCLLVGQL